MINWPWLAGFVEGEGSFSGSQRTTNYFQPNFSLYQKDVEILLQVQAFLEQEGISCIVGTYASQQCSTLSINRIDMCQELYRLIRPHMNAPVKILQADTWITKFSYKGRNVKVNG